MTVIHRYRETSMLGFALNKWQVDKGKLLKLVSGVNTLAKIELDQQVR